MKLIPRSILISFTRIRREAQTSLSSKVYDLFHRSVANLLPVKDETYAGFSTTVSRLKDNQPEDINQGIQPDALVIAPRPAQK